MGTVAEMLRKRERRDTRKRLSWLGLLWFPPVAVAFITGARLLPVAESPWLAALLRAGLGSLIVLVVAATARLARLVLGKPTLSAALGIKYAFLMNLFFSVQALFPARLWPDDGLRVLLGSGTAGVLAAVVLAISGRLAMRRERRMREAEVARLVGRF